MILHVQTFRLMPAPHEDELTHEFYVNDQDKRQYRNLERHRHWAHRNGYSVTTFAKGA